MAIRHSTPADSSFSVAGKAAWDAGHTGDASDLSFSQSGTGASAGTVQDELRKVVRASQFSGATADVKINAAITSLLASSTTGGIVDATDLTGAQTIAATISVGTAGKPVWLKLGRTSFSVTSAVGANAAIDIVSEGSAVTGFPVGTHSSNGAGTVLTSATGHTGKLIRFDPAAVGDSRVTIEDLFLDSNNISAYGLYVDHFAGLRVKRVVAARSTTDGFRIGPTAGSYTAELEECYSNDATTAAFHVSATLVRLARCVSDGSQYSVLADGTDGNTLWITPGCHFEGATVAALKFNGTSGGFNVMGSKIFPYGKNAHGIQITNTNTQRHSKIIGNEIKGQGDGTGTGIGITLEGTNGDAIQVMGNTIRIVEYGMSLTGNDCAIGPNFLDTLREGIAVAGNNNSIVGGRISTSGTDAIKVYSGTGNESHGVKSSQAFNGIVNFTDDATSWTPTNAAVTVTFTNARYVCNGRLVTATCKAVWGVTADATAATIGGLPYTSQASAAAVWGGTINASDLGAVYPCSVMVDTNAKTFKFYNNAFTALANSSFSGKTVTLTVTYERAI